MDSMQYGVCSSVHFHSFSSFIHTYNRFDKPDNRVIVNYSITSFLLIKTSLYVDIMYVADLQ